MKPSALFEALHALIGQRLPLHIWGACGVGKSQIVAQVADDLNWHFLDIQAVQLDPVDLRGLPGSPQTTPSGCRRRFCRQADRASCFWMNSPLHRR